MKIPTNHREYPTPVRLDKALRDIQKAEREILPVPAGHTNTYETSVDDFIKRVNKDENLASRKIITYLNRGSSALAFETPDEKILKLSMGNHFPMNRPHEKFDVPIYEKGHIGRMFYYLEEKLFQHGLSEPFVEIVRDKIKKAGYKPFDIHEGDVHQIGISSKGEVYLLDPECARYKTIFHALFAKTKKLLRK
ncbi:MAG: hypothetical protein KHX03_05880 [Clostridium sp.]|nr:hypothetical protein [Clostridium sp.]